MRKIIILLAITALFMAAVTSCKSYEKCPAFSKANTEEINKKV